MNYLRFFFGGILFIVLAPICFVLWVVCVGFVLPALFMDACCNRSKNPIVYLILLPFGMLAALILGAVIAPFVALCYIFMILGGIYAALKFVFVKL